MKRVIPILVIALALAAFYFRSAWLPAAPGSNAWLGAVDARMVLVAPVATARIVGMKAAKGERILSGRVLFAQDDAAAKAQLAQAQASFDVAAANLQNLLKGQRPEELAVYDQQLAEAKSSLELAQTNFNRTDSLNSRGIATQSQFDANRSAVEVAKAKVAEIEAVKKVAQLPARVEAVAAARSSADQAQAAVNQAQAQLDNLAVHAPADAIVDDVFFNIGEVAIAGQPVVSLLTDDALVLRFFVPEPARVKLQPGTEVQFFCDGCATGLKAKVSHIFAQPEFTPPVIYSESARGKLVYQVEARIEGAHPELQPGLPVQVDALP
ncbi:HlyD family secretion protein [Aestuariivirga litoralis]|uniref:HlyD family secretion protein n=1 Tax=Aestuariivirga litoralis TaxID=2650924 RepID=UPI0018C4A572|nr:HlyD family efflux transporter periplasmic adaptor subunit [Aestuariivirga litoralis]MBG1233454.1 HlyD family efflux transporter periplasmic adaptor subunit [Aestuariivirga litoralis]